MTDPRFHEGDHAGQKTLETIARADRFNEWMYRTIVPHCSGKILEIGSGIGNISQFFLRSGSIRSITLSDIREDYCRLLHQKFSLYETLEEVLLMDLSEPEFERHFMGYHEAFDTLFALNVIEHIRDDHAAIQNCRYLLKKTGRLVILVPAYSFLYCGFDEALGHYRRYTIKSLNHVFRKNGLDIVHSQYFNFTGILGWFFSGKILKKRSIPSGQMGFYNRMVPFFKVIDKMILNSSGLSVITVGRK